MKGYACALLALSLAALAETTVHWSFLCGSEKEVKLLPHENCSHFYVCFEGKQTELRCPRGLHFNKKTQLCDHPHRAGCESDPLWAIIALRSQVNEAPFSLLALVPSGAIGEASHQTVAEKGASGYRRSQRIFRSGSDEQRQLSKGSVTPVECPPDKYVRHEHFACVSGRKVPIACPSGTYYDDARSRCQRKHHKIYPVGLGSHKQVNWAGLAAQIEAFRRNKEIADLDARHGCPPGTHYIASRCEPSSPGQTDALHQTTAKKGPGEYRNPLRSGSAVQRQLSEGSVTQEVECPPDKYVRHEHFVCVSGRKVPIACPSGTYYDHARSRCQRKHHKIYPVGLGSHKQKKWADLAAQIRAFRRNKEMADLNARHGCPPGTHYIASSCEPSSPGQTDALHQTTAKKGPGEYRNPLRSGPAVQRQLSEGSVTQEVECPPDKYVRHEHFVCVSGRKVPIACPSGTYYDDARSRCQRKHYKIYPVGLGSHKQKKWADLAAQIRAFRRNKEMADLDARHGCPPGTHYIASRCEPSSLGQTDALHSAKKGPGEYRNPLRSGSAVQRQISEGSVTPVECPPDKYVRREHFVCISGRKVPIACPGGTYYNEARSRCERKHEAVEIPQTLPDKQFKEWSRWMAARVDKMYSDKTTSKAAPKSFDQQHDADAKKSFVDIQAQDDARHGCPPGTHYIGGRCQRRTDGSRVLTCPQHLEGKHLRNHHDCKTYYICDKGIKKLFDCPPNTFFEPNVNKCTLNGKWQWC